MWWCGLDDVPSIVSQLRYEEEQGYLHQYNKKNMPTEYSNERILSSEKEGVDHRINTIEHFFKQLTDPIFLQDGTYKIIWINASLKQKFNINDKTEKTEKPCYSLIFNKCDPCPFCPMEKAIRTKRTHEIQINSEPVGPCTIISIPLFSDDYFIGVLQQIKCDNQKNSNLNEIEGDILQTQQTIIENAALGIIVLDKHLNHCTINPAFSGMTGYEKTELKQKSEYPVYWPKKFKEEIETEIQRLQQKGQLKMETYFQRKDNSIFPVSIVGSTFIDNNTHEEHIILIVDDITKSKATERELKISQLLLLSLIQNLERKVKDRTQKIEELLKQKNEFINQLGHDLKNPLGPLVNLLPILIKYEEDPKKIQMLQVINRNTNHMKNLIIKTIELARLNSGNIKLNFEELDLREICNECIIRNEHLIQDTAIQIENNLKSKLPVTADKLRMEELFDNIITNSIKYSPDGGKIIIDGSSTETTVTISIKDHGIGMSKDQLDHVFDEFYKADPARHDFKSSGLGTSIIKRIVEKHGGHIKIESDGKGLGTTVTFTIQKSPTLSSKQNNPTASHTKNSNTGEC